jgi:hypothetical protein
MIRIACTNCKTVLSIDDAFAGGVCRCQHCGTIQTVPARARDTAGVGGSSGSSKALYRNQAKGEGSSGTGLDDLANAVASSGLSGSGLSSRRLTRPADGVTVTPDKRKNLLPIFIAIGAAFVVLLIIILWLALRGPAANPVANSPAAANNPQAVAPNPTSPNFCGIQLTGSSVIYLLDRGSATREMFGGLKEAAYKSAASLGSERMFQIMFWDNGSVAAYPKNSTTYATPGNIEAARSDLDDVSAYGAADIKPALTQALTHSPDVIVIATAKGEDLDDAWVKDVLASRGSSPVKIDTVSLGSNSNSAALKDVAAKTGGEYKEVNSVALQAFIGP